MDSDPVVEVDPIVSKLFEGVFQSAAGNLVSADGPLAAEVWGSALMAIWPDEDGGGDGGFTEALVRQARYLGTPEALAVLVAIAAVAPARLATKARTAAAELERVGVAAPAWARTAGRAQPAEAWVGTDVYGDQDILIMAFEYPGRGALPTEGAHTICVLIDHNQGGAAKDAYPAAALPATLASWREAQTNGIRLRRVSLSEASARLADALVAAEFSGSAEVDRTRERQSRLAELWSLLTARQGALPPGERPGGGELGLEDRQRLVAAFLESPDAGGLLSEPSAVGICERLIAFRCDPALPGFSGDGDPLRWSPTLVVRCLLEYLPARADLDESDLGLVPDVLTAWARYAGRRKALGADAMGRTLAAVEMCRQDFLVAMAADRGDGDLAATG